MDCHSDDKIIFRPIGIFHTPFLELSEIPKKTSELRLINSRIEIFSEYLPGIDDLKGFSHLIILFHLNKSKDYKLKVVPIIDNVLRGVFSTRSPRRPNSIGFTVVLLDHIDKNIIYIKGADVLDGTPVIDIKPYIPESDSIESARIGWITGK